jgi:hypothetical protein
MIGGILSVCIISVSGVTCDNQAALFTEQSMCVEKGEEAVTKHDRQDNVTAFYTCVDFVVGDPV